MGTISVSWPSDGTTADAADISTPGNTIVNEINGNLDNANIKSNAAIAGSKLADGSVDLGSKASTWDGWIAVSDSWSYASSTTVTVPSDATTKYSVGDKIKFTQTSTKYFYVSAVSATTLTITGGSDYTVANAAISGIYYSKAETPLGFPDWFATAPTLGGWSSNPASGLYYFSMCGRTVIFNVVQPSNGTSNATTCTVTLPITAVTRTNARWSAPAEIVDNGTLRTAPGFAVIDSAGTLLTVALDYGFNAFTTSGGKRIASLTIEYQVA